MRTINPTINYRASRGIESKSLEACNETSCVYRCSREILRMFIRPETFHLSSFGKERGHLTNQEMETKSLGKERYAV